jgi:hypothetical protein
MFVQLMAMAIMFILKTSGGQAGHAKFPFSELNLKIKKMKKIRLLGLFFILIMIIIGCEELKDPAGERGVALAPSVSTPNPGFFISGSADSYIRFSVDILTEAQPEKTDIVVSHGTNFERVKIAEVTTFPATVSITLGEVLTAIGTDISDVSSGDVIYVEVETTFNGRVTRSSASLAIPVVCEFDPDLAIGQYRAVAPDWPADGPVTLTADPADPYKIYVSGLAELDGAVEDLGPLVMHIDPATLKVTAEKTKIASDFFGYHNYSFESASQGSFNTCDGKYTMIFKITVDEGSFGNYSFTLTRK